LDKYVPHNGTQWMPFFGFMTSDVTGYWHSAFLLEIAFVHAPRLFRFVFTLVSIRNEFVDTLDRFLRVVSEPFRRDLRLWRSVPVHLSATGALVRNSYMATSLFACDSNNVEKWMALVTGLITSTSLVNAGSLLFLHLKCYYNTSVSKGIVKYFLNIMGSDDDYEPQSM